jgi:hypothetical protein
MESFHNYRLLRESYLRQRKRGRVNPGFILKVSHRRRIYVAEIAMGGSDSLDVFRVRRDRAHYDWPFELVVLSMNTRLGYVGLEVFTPGDQEDGINSKWFEMVQLHSLFMQSTEEQDELLGKDALDRLTPMSLARRLFELAQECSCA